MDVRHTDSTLHDVLYDAYKINNFDINNHESHYGTRSTIEVDNTYERYDYENEKVNKFTYDIEYRSDKDQDIKFNKKYSSRPSKKHNENTYESSSKYKNKEYEEYSKEFRSRSQSIKLYQDDTYSTNDLNYEYQSSRDGLCTIL